MRKRVQLLLALITIAIAVIWSYRVRAWNQSLDFEPTAAPLTVAQAGTELQAWIIDPIPLSAPANEMVKAFVSTPAILNAATASAKLDEVSASKGGAVRARLHFVLLAVHGGVSAIQTQPITLIATIPSDTDILTSAFRTMIGAAIGAGLGASSGDRRLLERGLMEGAATGLPVKSAISVTFVLTADLTSRSYEKNR